MKNYLSLAGVQAKAHRKQNRMTIFCIALAVFLVTGMFTMVDVLRTQQLDRMVEKHGSWHINLSAVPEEKAEEILADRQFTAVSRYDAINADLEKEYYVAGKKAVVLGVDEGWQQIMEYEGEGSLPVSVQEAAVYDNVKAFSDLQVGDMLTLTTPEGNYAYKISGIVTAKDENLKEQDACGLILTYQAFCDLAAACGEPQEPVLYLQFASDRQIQKTIKDLMDTYSLTAEQIYENAALLGMTGNSSSDYITGLYAVAGMLMLLVVLAGILMIAGSMNTNVAQRTQYFGMLRCIGSSKSQVRRLVLFEALNWCKLAIPIAVVLATAAAWGICATMRYGIGGEWSDMPVFRVSVSGILTGAVVGVITVLLAAYAPARRAARVTPVSAISGNLDSTAHAALTKAANTSRGKVDRALGIHHAVSKKKSLILLTGSFALSIVIFLCFSVMIAWIDHALTSNKPYTPDASVYYENYSESISRELAEQLRAVDGVTYAYGRMHLLDKVESDKAVSEIDLISYDEIQFQWAEADLLKGKLEQVRGEEGCVMTVFDKNNPLELGDRLVMNGQTLIVEAVLSDSPFSSSDIPTVICSEQTFTKVTGKEDYAVIDLQVKKKSGDAAMAAVRSLLPEGMKLGDIRDTKEEANSTYLTFCLLVYGFLVMIALITVFNIINSIAMSVTARSKQYAIMRAIGMDNHQVRRMISAETFTYALSGCMTGCVIGLPLHFLFFRAIISNYWGDAWNIPIPQLAIILGVVLGSAWLAQYKPVKQILAGSVVESRL